MYAVFPAMHIVKNIYDRDMFTYHRFELMVTIVYRDLQMTHVSFE